jgi:ABC-type phosphate transport system auxiliary subunit
MDPAVSELAERLTAENRRHFDEVAAAMRQHVEATAVETRQYVEATAAETRRELRGYIGVEVEELRHQLQVVAEGHLSLDGKLEDLRGEVRLVSSGLERFRIEAAGEFTELRSMIRLSYAEIDRRLRTLEDVVAALQTRVERLESGSH